MKSILIGLSCIVGTAQAATIVQTKAKSAIVQVSESEVDGLKLAAGQNIQFTANGNPVQAQVVKMIKNKILIKSDTDLTGQQNANIELSIPLGASMATPEAAAPMATSPRKVVTKDRAFVNKSAMPKKPLTFGINVKYVKGTAKVQYADTLAANGSVLIAGGSANLSTSGFELSGTGLYSIAGTNWNVGGEASYASLKGSVDSNSTTITQMQVGALGEYKINAKFTAGISITLASNYKASDNLGNDSSLNAMFGPGFFATYQINPKVRAILDYKTMTYKLDANKVDLSDIRLGAGYYF